VQEKGFEPMEQVKITIDSTHKSNSSVTKQGEHKLVKKVSDV